MDGLTSFTEEDKEPKKEKGLFEKIKDTVDELIKLQQKPKIHVGLEEKIPHIQYGHKTYTFNVSFFADTVEVKDIDLAVAKVRSALEHAKREDGLIDEFEEKKQNKSSDNTEEPPEIKWVEAGPTKDTEPKVDPEGKSMIDKLMEKEDEKKTDS